ncbi:hypothetical protein PC114_g27501 [Phytophthora cactorum]|nr:hypothetical protein PC114_g27501 [Phytophthora cactorum]KAG3127630.1 hypothetical protein PC128_g27069 [Phytophthora cactorum]
MWPGSRPRPRGTISIVQVHRERYCEFVRTLEQEQCRSTKAAIKRERLVAKPFYSSSAALIQLPSSKQEMAAQALLEQDRSTIRILKDQLALTQKQITPGA